MPLPPDQAWFPTKDYGWGWGLPRRPEGWVATGVCILLVLPESVVPPPYNPYCRLFKGYFEKAAEAIVPAGSDEEKKDKTARMLYQLAVASAFVGLAFWKGERPGWRWGGK
jgi:hypothetical protein